MRQDPLSKKLFIPLLVGLALISLLLLAGGVSDLRFRPGQSLNLIEWFFSELESQNQDDFPELTPSPADSQFLPEIGDVLLNSLIAVFWLLAFFTVLNFIISPKFRRDLIRMIAWIIPLVIILPQIARSMTQNVEIPDESQPGGMLPGETSFPQAPDFVQNPPEWLFLLTNAILLLLIFIGLILIWRKFRPQKDTKAIVLTEIRRALADLDSGVQLKNVVFACYAQMCHEFQEKQGVKRHRAMTPREFEVQLLEAGFASHHIQKLTQLFEAVRYGGKSVDLLTENEAKISLSAILEAYGD
jgi:hypothetical protein